VADFMAMVGKPPMEWQRRILREAFARRKDGKWAAYEVAVFVARQNGKGVITEAQELFGLYMLREQKVIHSAHLFDTAQEAFKKILELIDGSDWLRQRTAKVNKAHGKEGITLTAKAGGGELKFKARTVHGTRGFSGDRVILDEAYGLTAAQFSAISPVLATRVNPQITYTSSPPDEKTGPMPEDAMAPSIRKRGLAGDPRLAYFEWSPPDGFDVARATDVDEWYRCNPSLGILIEEEFLASQLRIFRAAGKSRNFATEHLGLWPPDASAGWEVIGEDSWHDAVDVDSAPEDPVAFAIATNHDRTWTSIGVAGRRRDGLRHVEIVARQPGTAWVVDWLTRRGDDGLNRVARWEPCAIVVNPGTPAGSLIPEIEDAFSRIFPPPKLVKPSERDFTHACGAFYDGIAGEVGPDEAPRVVRDVRHRGQEELTASVRQGIRRDIGRAWAWETREEGGDDTSPLEAATLALWGHATRAKNMPINIDGNLM
jgi:hypothetical protein